MYHYVYILKPSNIIKKTYVGYSTDVLSRLKNTILQGAKSTKGYKWKVIFKKNLTKSNALSFEYSLKKDRKKDYP